MEARREMASNPAKAQGPRPEVPALRRAMPAIRPAAGARVDSGRPPWRGLRPPSASAARTQEQCHDRDGERTCTAGGKRHLGDSSLELTTHPARLYGLLAAPECYREALARAPAIVKEHSSMGVRRVGLSPG